MRKVFHAIWFLSATTSFGQIINTTMTGGKTKDGTSGNFELSSTKTTGNSETFIMDATSSVSYRRGDSMIMGKHKRVQGVSGKETFADATFVHIRARQYINSRWAWEVFVQNDRNPFKSLSNREIIGAGPRFESGGFAMGFALMKEVAEYSDNRKSDEYRYSIYVDYKYAWDDVISFSQTAYYQPKDSGTSNLFSLFDQSDQRLLSETGLKIQIGKDWYFKLVYRIDADTEPEDGVAKVDTNFKNILSFSF